MKRSALIPAFILAALLGYSCTQSGPCEGSLTLENPIPDTTVAVGDTLFIDLSDPPAFVSSEGGITYDYDIVSGVLNISSNLIANPNDNERFSLLLISGKMNGEATIDLKGRHGCLENNLTFNITITE